MVDTFLFFHFIRTSFFLLCIYPFCDKGQHDASPSSDYLLHRLSFKSKFTICDISLSEVGCFMG